MLLKTLFSSRNLGAAFISTATVHPDWSCLGMEAQGSLFRDHILPHQPGADIKERTELFLCTKGLTPTSTQTWQFLFRNQYQGGLLGPLPLDTGL